MKREIFTFLLMVFLTAGCVPYVSTPTSTIPLNTLSPIVEHKPTPSPIPSPVPSFEDNCVEVKTVDMNELKSVGTIVLEDINYKAHTIDADTFEKVEITKEDEIAFSIAVSPNRQMAAYELYSRSNDVSNLIIMDSSRVSQLIVPWEENWTFISSWLNDQSLLINDYDELSEGNPWLAAKEFSTFLVVNPFTDEEELLQPEFPNIYSHHMFPSWTGFGSTVYNPTLDRVVYMRADSVDADFHYVLWDLDKQLSLADFKVFVSGQDIPRWSPDGDKFAIAMSSDIWLSYNLYTVSRDGDVVELTDLDKYYPWHYVGQHSWSPDGRYIAFWLSGWMEPPQSFDLFESLDNQHLAIVDTSNNDLSVFCISGNPYESWTAFPPVWSPNGQQVLVESPLSENHSQVLLFDLDKKIMAVVGNDMTPVGWMVAP